MKNEYVLERIQKERLDKSYSRTISYFQRYHGEKNTREQGIRKKNSDPGQRQSKKKRPTIIKNERKMSREFLSEAVDTPLSKKKKQNVGHGNLWDM